MRKFVQGRFAVAGRCVVATVLALAGLASAGLPVRTAAASEADVSKFYSGKQMKLIIGYGPGGGFDIYGRTVAKYLEKYIPGKPNIVPQNMEGAGTIRAANWLYNAADQDGSYIGLISGQIPLNQAMKSSGVQFDASKFNWIGNPDAANRITMIMANSGIRTIDDLKANGEKAICGGPGVTTQSIQFPQIMNNLLGTKMRIIAGYPDGAAVSLAMERGEVNCRAGNTWAGVKSASPEWVRDKKVNVLAQWGPEDNPEIAEYMGFKVPLSLEFARNEADRRAINLLQSSVGMGRPFLAPPNVPTERVAALRKAFDMAVKDPQFLADAEKLQLDINPYPGVKVQQYASEVATSDDTIVKLAKALSEPTDVKDISKK